jgi:Trk K+ transport system NAD-binding subunit
MVERQVIGTMSVGRSALMIADVPVVAGSPLVGQPVSAANTPDRARAIALQRHGVGKLDWAPGPDYQLAPQDRLTVVATRAGLGDLLDRSIPAVPEQSAG